MRQEQQPTGVVGHTLIERIIIMIEARIDIELLGKLNDLYRLARKLSDIKDDESTIASGVRLSCVQRMAVLADHIDQMDDETQSRDRLCYRT